VELWPVVVQVHDAEIVIFMPDAAHICPDLEIGAIKCAQSTDAMVLTASSRADP